MKENKAPVIDESKGVTSEQLLEICWNEKSRPSLQWLWQHTGREIPAVKIGKRYIYQPAKVRAALGLA